MWVEITLQLCKVEETAEGDVVWVGAELIE